MNKKLIVLGALASTTLAGTMVQSTKADKPTAGEVTAKPVPVVPGARVLTAEKKTLAGKGHEGIVLDRGGYLYFLHEHGHRMVEHAIFIDRFGYYYLEGTVAIALEIY